MPTNTFGIGPIGSWFHLHSTDREQCYVSLAHLLLLALRKWSHPEVQQPQMRFCVCAVSQSNTYLPFLTQQWDWRGHEYFCDKSRIVFIRYNALEFVYKDRFFSLFFGGGYGHLVICTHFLWSGTVSYLSYVGENRYLFHASRTVNRKTKLDKLYLRYRIKWQYQKTRKWVKFNSI